MIMDIINTNQHILDIIRKYNLQREDESLRKEYSISTPEEWQMQLDEMEQEDRLLRIGIIGRVKAGKSSLLNALLFNGQDILPKAATPMTAALTILEYAETLEAEIDFFTPEDIANFKEKHSIHLQTLRQIEEEEFQKAQEYLKKKKQKEDPLAGRLFQLSASEEEICRAKAKEIAKKLGAERPTQAAYDQYERIKVANISLDDLKNGQRIEASSYTDLMDKLNQYVGAQGQFMPFTKSVTLRIPEEGLKGLQVVDTPGLNDPVQSRSQRTEEYLSQCDAVLVVSPAGQFLTKDDTELLSQLTEKEGIQDIFLVASQTDLAIMGPEYSGCGFPSEAYEDIAQKLSTTAHNAMFSLKKEGFITDAVAQKILEHPIVLTSSAGYRLLQQFNQLDHLDDEELKHTYTLLEEKFSLMTSTSDILQEQLLKMSNIAIIHNIVATIRERKTDIIAKRRDNFEKAKALSIEKYVDAWKKLINDKIQQIESVNIHALKEQLHNLHNKKQTILEEIPDCYLDNIDTYIGIVRKEVWSITDTLERSLDNATEEYQSTHTKTIEDLEERSWSNLFGLLDRTKRKEISVTTVSTTQLRREFQKHQNRFISNLNDIFNKTKKDFKTQLSTSLKNQLRQIFTEEELNPSITRSALRRIIQLIPDDPIQMESNIPQELKKSGILKDKEAEDFLEAAQDYASRIATETEDCAKQFIQHVKSQFRNYPLAEELSNHLTADIEELISNIENKEASLFEQNNILKAFEQVNNNVH